MAIRPATKLGHYQVLAAIGNGGMGEVYRAHDANGPAGSGAFYSVSPDGQRFLMTKAPAQQQSALTQINVVLNWFEDLKKKVPLK